LNTDLDTIDAVFSATGTSVAMNIDGANIDSSPIGANTASTGAFTSLSATGTSTITTADINGGAIDGTTIGSSSASTGAFTTLSTTGVLTQDGGAVFNEASADVDFRVESNGNANMLFVDGGNDRVGIGTDSPSSLLQIESSTAWGAQLMLNQVDDGTTGAQLFLKHTSSSPADDDYVGFLSFKGENSADEEVQYARIYTTTADVTDGGEDGSLFFDTAVAGTQNTNVMSIVGGNVGIGTDSPSSLLTINEANGTPAFAIADDSSAGDYTTFQIIGAEYNGGINTIEAINTTGLAFSTGSGTEALRIDTSQNVGIGTASPQDKLQVKGGNITIASTDGASRYFGFTSSASEGTYVAKIESDHSANWGGNLKFFTGPSGGGNAERMRIDSSGAVTKPMQPGFSVKFSSSSDVDLTATGYTTIPFNSERWDNNGDFNTGTYTFTAPVTGKYQFDYSLGMNSMDNSNTWFAILIQTSNQSYHDWIAPDDMFTGGDLSGNFTMKTSAVADMDANDTCYARVYIYNGTASEFTYMGDDRISYMTGYLLG